MPSDPRVAARSVNSRPAMPPVMGGGTSSPTKSRCDFPDFPGSIPMYFPESRVPDAGHPAQGDARLHDPEPAVLDQQAFRVLFHLRRDDDLGEVLRKDHLRHLPDIDVLVLDEGLAGLDPLGRPERDPDRRPLVQVPLDDDPDADQRRDDRDDPDDRDPRAFFRDMRRFRNVREIGVFSHLSPAFPGWNPRSGGGRTIPRRRSSG